MIRQLVVNGCSYMDAYCQGLGHVDLAHRLGLTFAHKLAFSGCANSRIIRSTLKHSYTAPPTLYMLGITFMSRWELPINNNIDQFEGRWINPQAKDHESQWAGHWSSSDTELFKDLQFKAVALSQEDLLEDLMYRLISMMHDLRHRGHQVVIYNQVDTGISEAADNSKFQLLKSDPSFVHGLKWLAVPWQQDQGAPVMTYPPEREPPMQYRHIMPGKHQHLNTYLTNYIQEHKILT